MTRHHSNAGPSTLILEAQERLLALRAEFARAKGDSADQSAADPVGQTLQQAEAERRLDLGRVIAGLPPHLGWESEAVTRVVRNKVGQNCILSTRQAESLPYKGVGDGESESDCDCGVDEVRLHPALGLGMLRRKRAASGRVWLLLRAVDRTGQGWVALKTARKLLSGQDSPLRICGARHLRNLLAQGEQIFWEQRDERLWLHSVPRAAAALGVQRLDGRPVAIPIAALRQSIGQVRAHFYAAFHSGRKKAHPISRTALKSISQVSPRSQQNYEKRAGVRKQRNYAVGPRIKSQNAQEAAWQKGRACFSWHDHQAVHGSSTAVYLAWQLPNSYNGPHEQRPNGNRKRFNRQLADLSNKGMTGNGRPAVEFMAKRYCETAKAAVHSVGSAETAVYWRGSRPGLWHVLGNLNS